jgi:hypothetical protein
LLGSTINSNAWVLLREHILNTLPKVFFARSKKSLANLSGGNVLPSLVLLDMLVVSPSKYLALGVVLSNIALFEAVTALRAQTA